MGNTNNIKVKMKTDIIRDHVLNHCFKHLKPRAKQITVNKQIK